jgi:hypothetical protein
MEAFISLVVLIIAPFGLLFALERDITAEAERGISLFHISGNRGRSG